MSKILLMKEFWLPDDLSQSGIPILVTAIKSLDKTCTVHLVLSSISERKFLYKHLQGKHLSCGAVHDLCQRNREARDGLVYQDFLTAFRPESGTAVIIECLNDFLLHLGLTRTCQLLFDLSKKQKACVLALLHIDCIEEGMLPSIEKYASMISQIQESESGSHDIPVETKLISGSGRVTRKKEHVILNKSLELVDVKDWDPKPKGKVQPGGGENDPEKIMSRLTTFDLSLKEKERRARSRVQLPYMDKVGGGGHIFYTCDDADDFDEEDPDNDLDI
ncbi:unnamed protein product [Darwinula stevensoni]|uniref:Elongator complex protein 5 n=1 Tax=Darwinula stevensoni TaxID=69355 RepID=A0A7R9A251_9CRUS|nr:unnamed protein product [Darwinula stevensoni]CAG0887959.1 unnamed protein product [Darwinula stevensoni]